MKTGQRYELIVEHKTVVPEDSNLLSERFSDVLADSVTISDARMYISRYTPHPSHQVIWFLLRPTNG